MAPPKEKWLPVTDIATARQKMQRAFAAEFLCPIDTLLEHLGGDYSQDRMEEVAAHFEVSGLAVHTHLVNNGILSRDSLPG
jgi:Zn-dependent peptidase ImmA (M78 family)